MPILQFMKFMKFLFLIHRPGCRFIIATVLMVFEVSSSIGHQRRRLLYHLSASRQTGEKGFLRDPHPHKKPGSSACQSIISPARAILLTFWEAAILRSPVDFELMTFCFPYFQNRHRANLSFPGQWARELSLKEPFGFFFPFQFLFINSANSKT